MMQQATTNSGRQSSLELIIEYMDFIKVYCYFSFCELFILRLYEDIH
jgi:hypothetical protein